MPDNNTDTFVLCLGANTPDAVLRLSEAFDMISDTGTIGQVSEIYPTEPEYAGDGATYLNRVVVLKSTMTLDELQRRLKSYETAVRAGNKFQGLVNLDIDIVLHNTEILRPRDYNSSYFRLGFSSVDYDI